VARFGLYYLAGRTSPSLIGWEVTLVISILPA
jgi:hypothetical protein